jgi:hypothetical protein
MGKIASKHAHTPTLNNGSENNVFVVWFDGFVSEYLGGFMTFPSNE